MTTAKPHSSSAPIRWASGPELEAAPLYELLQLRVAVFVVEQNCPYDETDGLDLLATTHHGWIIDDTGVAAAIRVLGHESPPRLGRVVTRPDARGGGMARELVLRAHERFGQSGTSLDAQNHLVGWYEALGWNVAGDSFVEDGIPHTPMVRD